MWPHDASHARLSPPSLGLWTVVPLQWRRKYLSTLGMGSPAARQQPPKVSTGPKTSPILLNTEEPHSSHSHAHSRTVVVPPRRPPSVAASGAAPGPSAGSPGSSAGAPIDEDDFMYLDDDVFGWNNELESDVGAGGGSDEGASRGASRHARVVLPRRVYDASDCSLPANTFVPPHRLVSHDCFSLGVRVSCAVSDSHMGVWFCAYH